MEWKNERENIVTVVLYSVPWSRFNIDDENVDDFEEAHTFWFCMYSLVLSACIEYINDEWNQKKCTPPSLSARSANK